MVLGLHFYFMQQKVILKCFQNGEEIINEKLKVHGSRLYYSEGVFMVHLSTETTCTVKEMK